VEQIIGLKVKGQTHWERKSKIVFRAFFVKVYRDLRQTKIEMITGPFYTYHQIHFTSKNTSSLWFCP